MRHPLGVILPAVMVVIAAVAFDSLTAVTALVSAGGPGAAALSPWVTQAAVAAIAGWTGVALAVAALLTGSAALRLVAGIAWFTAAVAAWATPSSLVYAACALVGLLAAVDARGGRDRRRLRWSERTRAVQAGVVVTLASGPLSLVLGPVALLLTTVGAALMAVGAMAERDGLHRGEGSAAATLSTDQLHRARLRRRRIHAGTLSLGAGLIGLANLLLVVIDPPITGVDPTALILIGGLFLVAAPMLLIGLGLGAWTVMESRRLRTPTAIGSPTISAPDGS
jgi:hypothetical protein